MEWDELEDRVLSQGLGQEGIGNEKGTGMGSMGPMGSIGALGSMGWDGREWDQWDGIGWTRWDQWVGMALGWV